MNGTFDLKTASSVKSGYSAFAAQQMLGGAKTPRSLSEKAQHASEEFEAVYLNTMFSQMFTSLEGEGPFGGEKSLGVWRSFLTDEFAKSFAKKGGIGIAPEIYRTLMAQQEQQPDATPVAPETRP